MKFNFNPYKEKTEVVGVAIGDVHVRALQLAGSVEHASVVAFAESVMPKSTFEADGQVDAEGLAHVLENLFLKPSVGKFTTRDVVVNLPEARCFVRVIHVSSMSDSEIDAAVPFEAESYIPIPIEQVYLDWQRIGEVDGRVALLLVASPKQFVDQVLSAVSQAGLVCTALEVESLGLARALIPPGEQSATLIVDMKAAASNLVMVEKDSILFTSTVQIAGNSITDAIAHGLELPTQRAEEVKAEAGFGNTEEYPNLKTLLVPVANSLIAEIKQVMAFHDQHSTVAIGKIILVGGTAKLKHLAEFIKESLVDRPGLEVLQGDPTVNIHVTLPAELMGEAILPYVAVVGLAMRGFVI
jgi:type IV pilus assembly protein PilM